MGMAVGHTYYFFEDARAHTSQEGRYIAGLLRGNPPSLTWFTKGLDFGSGLVNPSLEQPSIVVIYTCSIVPAQNVAD